MLREFFIPMFLSLLLGALIGVQREIRQQTEKKYDLAGFRTFTFVSLLGFFTGFLSFELLDNIFYLLLTFVGIFVLLILSYVVVSRNRKNGIGIMTQILVLFSFIVGLLISLDYLYISIVLSITVSTILFLGDELHSFAKHLTKTEIFASLKFAIISLVVLPILPNKNYSPLDIPGISVILLNQSLISQEFLSQLNVFNLYHIWLMVVFVSGIAYVGYIATRIFGTNKGILLTGILGGFMSSTALTSSFSIESKRNKELYMPLAIGVIIACSVMFFRILFEVLVLNAELFMPLLLSIGLMGSLGLCLAVYLLFKFSDNKIKIKQRNMKSPFTLGPAFIFALIFVLVSLFSKIFSLTFGDSGIYILSFISGITDVDAITISLCGLVKNEGLNTRVASLGIVIAAISNTFFKAGIAYYLGSKKFFHAIFYVFSVILFLGGLSLLL